MTLTRNEYDGAYFGDPNFDLKHRAGYTNYKAQCSQSHHERKLKQFLESHNIPKDAKVLELGAGTGYLGKIARENGYDHWICVDWSQWCQDNKVFPELINQDAIEYLQLQQNKSFDYIISRGFIECFTATELITLANECLRVGKKQIHSTFLEVNSNYYTVKDLENWKTLFGNIDDIIVENYF